MNPLALEHINSWGNYFQQYSGLMDLRALSTFQYYVSSEEVLRVLSVFYPRAGEATTSGRDSPLTFDGVI